MFYVGEYGVEEVIWTWKRGSGRKLDKLHNEELSVATYC